MENNQPDQGVEDLAALLSDDPIEELEDDELEDEQLDDDDEGQLEDDDEAELEDEAEPEQEAEKYAVTVKNENGEDEQKELTLEELAQGYMLNSDYTRKRQAEAETLRQKEYEYQSAVVRVQNESANQIEQLKNFVIQSVAPQLQELTPQLAQTDPAKWVELNAMQQSVQSMLGQLDQTKSQYEAQSTQYELQGRQQFLQNAKEYLNATVPKYSDPEFNKQITEFAGKTYGIKAQDLNFLTSAPIFKDGGVLDSGKFIHILHDAMKYNEMKSQKPIQMQKVKSAPKVIKPKAPQPKQRNRDAARRLAKHGRIEDLAEFL